VVSFVQLGNMQIIRLGDAQFALRSATLVPRFCIVILAARDYLLISKHVSRPVPLACMVPMVFVSIVTLHAQLAWDQALTSAFLVSPDPISTRQSKHAVQAESALEVHSPTLI
jgi:hypothetical protein